MENKVYGLLVASRKAQDTDAILALSLVWDKITKFKKNRHLEVVADNDVISILRKEILQNEETKNAFLKRGHEEDKRIASTLTKQIIILEAILPKELSDEELEQTIITYITSQGGKDYISSFKSPRMLMKPVMALLDGKAQGNRVSPILNKVVEGF